MADTRFNTIIQFGVDDAMDAWVRAHVTKLQKEDGVFTKINRAQLLRDLINKYRKEVENAG